MMRFRLCPFSQPLQPLGYATGGGHTRPGFSHLVGKGDIANDIMNPVAEIVFLAINVALINFLGHLFKGCGKVIQTSKDPAITAPENPIIWNLVLPLSNFILFNH
jgi:hypothetical protein